MSRNNISDKEIWSWGGANDKPDAHRFEKGNETGPTALAPKNTDHNYQMNRADQNMQYVLRNATMPWNSGETYPAGARVTLGGKEYECKKPSTNNNPVTSPTYWDWIDNRHLPVASLTEKGIVQLSNSVSSDREDIAATSKSVKSVKESSMPLKSSVHDNFDWNGQQSNMPPHYFHNLFSDSDKTVYVHFYPQSFNENADTKVAMRVHNGNSYRTMTYDGRNIQLEGYGNVYHPGNKPTPGDVGAVPKERTINNKPLNTDITLTPSDIGSVPKERTINNKNLTTDITLAPSDVGAMPVVGNENFNWSGPNSQMPPHYYHGTYEKNGDKRNVYIHFFPYNETQAYISVLNLRIRYGTEYRSITYDGNNIHLQDIGNVYHPGNKPTASDVGLGDVGKAVTSSNLLQVPFVNDWMIAFWANIRNPHSLLTYNSLDGSFTTKIAGYYDIEFEVFRSRPSTGGSEQYGQLLIDGIVKESVETQSNNYSNASIKVVTHMLLEVGQKIVYQTKGSDFLSGNPGNFSIRYARPK